MKYNILKAIESYKKIRGVEVIIEFLKQEGNNITLFFGGSMIDHDPDAHIMDFFYEYEDIYGQEFEIKSYQMKNGGCEVVATLKN